MPQRPPVSIGNVTFLNGDPGQDAMAAYAKNFLGGADLEAALAVFSEMLLRAGRPGKRENITVEYGPRITDWLQSGAYLSRVPWHSHHWFKSVKIPMFELHSWSGSGWCAEVCDGVLLHVRFDGGDDGLDSQDMACLLSESPTPAQELVDWLQGLLEPERDFGFDDVANQMPVPLRELLGYDFQFGQRIISMWLGGNEAEGRFHAIERVRDIERAIF